MPVGSEKNYNKPRLGQIGPPKCERSVITNQLLYLVNYFEGGGHGIFESTIPAFVWRDWWKWLKPSVTIGGNPAEIWTNMHTALPLHQHAQWVCLKYKSEVFPL